MSISDYPGVLSSLVAEYPENKQALDYLLCYYLLNENLNSFKNTFDTYYKGKFEVVPRLYEEALVQVLSKSSDEEVAGYQIPQDVIENYQDYRVEKQRRNYENVIPPPIGTTLTIFIE